MRVSQRLDYTLRGLVALAAEPPGTLVAAGAIADRLGLPRRFLEQQFTLLTRASIVECRRGVGGGCRLARPAADLTVAAVVAAVQGRPVDVPHVSGSAVSEMWGELSADVGRFLTSVTIADLVTRQAGLDAASSAMYYI